MRARILCVFECEVKSLKTGAMVARNKLDSFREAVLPRENYGVTLVKADHDYDSFLLGNPETVQIISE